MDLLRARQVLDGLIENALRVSPPDTSINISLRPAGGHAQIAIQDQGPGLSDDDLAHAFERGVLRARYQDSRLVGTGLGPSIAARLVARLGGELQATRMPEGGTAFTVSWKI